jgi:hypothetical protein
LGRGGSLDREVDHWSPPLDPLLSSFEHTFVPLWYNFFYLTTELDACAMAIDARAGDAADRAAAWMVGAAAFGTRAASFDACAASCDTCAGPFDACAAEHGTRAGGIAPCAAG